MPKLGLCTVKIQLGSTEISALCDTGSSYTIITHDLFQYIQQDKTVLKSITHTNKFALAASGDKIKFLKIAKLHFKISHLSWTHPFMVAPSLPVPVVLGTDFLHKAQAIIDMGEQTISFPYGSGVSLAVAPVQETHITSDVHYKVGEHLTPFEINQVKQLIAEFPDVVTKRLGRTGLIEYDITLNSNKIVRSSPYQFNPIKMQKLRDHIKELLEKDVIEPSTSPYSCPGFLVDKKGTDKSRFVVNYKPINNLMSLESTPSPTVEQAFQYLGSSTLVSIIDMNSAYHQIPLTKRSRKYTAFTVPFGLYQYKTVPFGIGTGGQVLTRLLDQVLGDLRYISIFLYFDDVIIFSKGSLQDHLLKLKEVLRRLRNAGLTVNPDKLTIASRKVEFLGHIFSNGTVTFDRERIRPILDLPPPKNPKQIARLVGLMAYYARFVPHFSALCEPLNRLRRKNVPFIWGPEQTAALDAIKKALTSHPVLRLPNFNLEFVLSSDGSGSGLGAQLSQEYDGVLLPVAYASRPLTKHEKNKDTLELECSAVVFGLQRFQQYLEHRPFKLQTDSSSLNWLLNHPRQVGKIARWISFINSFTFTSEHIRGENNHIPDLLSRMFEDNQPTTVPLETSQNQNQNPHQAAPVVSVLTKIPEVFKDIAEHQREDPELIKIIKNKNRSPPYSLKDGVLMHQGPNQNTPRIVIPSKLMDMLFKFYHVGTSFSHAGSKKTVHQITKHFWGPNLSKIIADKVRSCVLCQRSKQATNTKVGKLSSEITTRPWEKIHIDFIGRLPRSNSGNQYLLTVVDSFSKFTVLLPARNQTAKTTVNLLTKNIFSHFGFPKFLTSDRGQQFRSHLVAEMCMAYGIKHIFTSPFKPSSNISERVNKQLKIAMRIYHSKEHKTWDQNIHFFELAYNTSTHSSTGFSPAKLFLGREIKHPLDLAWNLSELVPDDPEANTEDLWQAAVTNLRKARQKREQQYNAGRQDNPFKEGDWVMYRLHPQSKAADGITRKLMPVWSKPCKIERFTSPVSVRLINPSTGKYVNSAHVSQLKRFFRPSQ